MLERRPSPDGAQCIVAARNRALSSQQWWGVYAALVVLSVSIATACAALGAWGVWPFTVLELSAVGFAFLWWSRHADDREIIDIAPDLVRVEIHEAGRKSRHQFNTLWVQLVVNERGAQAGLALRGEGREVALGRYLDAAGRRALARQLRGALAACR